MNKETAMITNTPNNIEKRITRVLKGSQECHRLYGGDKLIFSPYTLMGTTYHSSNEVIWSRGSASSAASDLYSIFEILGEAGTDEGGTYYNFGWRVTGLRRNGTQATQEQFENEIAHFFNTDANHPLCTYFRSINLYSNPTYSLRLISPLQQNLTTLKEVDFKDFSTKGVVNFSPCTFASGLQSVLNLDTITFYQDGVKINEAFRSTPLTSFTWNCFTLYKVNGSDAWFSTFRDMTQCTQFKFAQQPYANTCRNLTYTWTGCKAATVIEVDKLYFTSLIILDAAFQGCEALTAIPMQTTPTNNIQSWISTFRGCKLISDISILNLDSAITLAETFSGMEALKNVDWSTQNLSRVTSIKNVFAQSGLENIQLPTTNKLAPIYADGAFSYTKITNLPQNLDTIRITVANAMYAGCSEITGALVIPANDYSAVLSCSGMFTSCTGITSITFSGTSLVNCTNWGATFERDSSLEYIYGLNLTSATVLDSTFYLCSALKQVIGTKPTGVVQMKWPLYACTALEHFIDMSGLKIKDNALFAIGHLPSKANDLHIETWTAEDGVSKPTVYIKQYAACYIPANVANEYNVDFGGWTFLSGYSNTNADLKFSFCAYPLVNIDTIKIRIVASASTNEPLEIDCTSAFQGAKVLTVDTTNWLDNTNIPSLTKIPIKTNSQMFRDCIGITKIVLKNLLINENSEFANVNVFTNCSTVTSFECDYTFFDALSSQIFDLSPFTQWVNAVEIEAFLTQLTIVTSKRYTNSGNNFRLHFSASTLAVIQGLSNYSTILSAMQSHGWEIV